MVSGRTLRTGSFLIYCQGESVVRVSRSACGPTGPRAPRFPATGSILFRGCNSYSSPSSCFLRARSNKSSSRSARSRSFCRALSRRSTAESPRSLTLSAAWSQRASSTRSLPNSSVSRAPALRITVRVSTSIVRRVSQHGHTTSISLALKTHFPFVLGSPSAYSREPAITGDRPAGTSREGRASIRCGTLRPALS